MEYGIAKFGPAGGGLTGTGPFFGKPVYMAPEQALGQNRLRETLKMEWAWIDREKKHVLLPPTVTKNKRPHLVPLVPQALKLLDMLKELCAGSEYVFPGPTGDL